MKRFLLHTILLSLFVTVGLPAFAWVGMPTPRLRVEGRYLKDPHGNIVNLHGTAVTPSPWFNGGQFGTWRWNNYDVEGCLNYNKAVIDKLTDPDEGWFMSYIRLHIDPYWTNLPGTPIPEHDISRFRYDRLVYAVDNVIMPLIDYAKERGLYVILRPPGVCPEEIEVGDDYQQYLTVIWDYLSKHPGLKNADHVMFELANEPVRIKGTDGNMGSNSQAHFDALKLYFQPLVDLIRANGADNILWIPGSAYQSHYKGFAVNPIEGHNIGYAVHIYPGYWGGVRNYNDFKRAWDENVKPVADFAPIAITEIDWSPDGVGSWGVGVTGVAGGEGFGANFKKITDESGNVSWNLLLPDNLLKDADPNGPLAYDGDPEACAYPSYIWWQEYANYDKPKPDFIYQSRSDNGDGTFTNPLIYSDFSSPDVIRAGNRYYMVSSSGNRFSGVTLLSSPDLVNWEYVSNPVENIAGYNALNGTVESKLNYHQGVFYIVVSVSNGQTLLLSATNPEKEWTTIMLSDDIEHAGLFFDADGKVYLYHGVHSLGIKELDDDFQLIGNGVELVSRPESDLRINQMLKNSGYYYLFATYSGVQPSLVVFRSENLTGPYEERAITSDIPFKSGALVETQTGEWWAVLSGETGIFGHTPNLQTISWISGWPVIGALGQTRTTFRKPNVGRTYIGTTLPTTDNFRNYKLGLQWAWSNHAEPSGWSIFERPGFLRLHTVDLGGSLSEAHNILSQRVFGFHSGDKSSYATIRLETGEMLSGDLAGLAIMHGTDDFVGVRSSGGVKQVVVHVNNVEHIGSVIDDDVVYLRVVTNGQTGITNFYYSPDNLNYHIVSEHAVVELNASASVKRFAIFNIATEAAGGYVDIDWFTTEEVFNEDMFYDDRFTGFTEEELTLDYLYMLPEEVEMLLGTNKTISLYALFQDGHSENVTLQAAYSNSNPDVIEIRNGQLIAKKPGETTITASYEGKLGGLKTLEFTVKSMMFPLTAELFNPSIWETGSFNPETGELRTGQWGFGGWRYDNGLNLSGYKYLVVRLKVPTSSGAAFRIFDQSNYWAPPVTYDMGSATQLVVELKNMTKSVNGQTVAANPSSIYIVGFWSHGNAPIYIDTIYLSNSDDLTPTSISEEVLANDLGNLIVDVYSLMGVKIRSAVQMKDATTGLPRGVYVIGNAVAGYKKVLVSMSAF
ncbi:family 43 glycosylhydrolase [Alkaliflexus imshenetskii]|uniref:family 43 glycosylhydrolase n=1 Tax=Alkaliflexus imshenetskii TaxID=286730 RepID=UPI0004B645B2|nr:family 43 glycosylhydrolase [Alkaliflexus imshenetskii]